MDIQIETARLRLRPYTRNDLDALHRLWTDPDVRRYLFDDKYGFEALGFNEIIASADAPNEASVRVMEKAGMTFQKHVLLDGLDTIYYAIAREDFEADDAFYRVFDA